MMKINEYNKEAEQLGLSLKDFKEINDIMDKCTDNNGKDKF